MGPECGNAKLGGMINTTQFGTSQPTSNGHHTNINANMNHLAVTVAVAVARGRGKGKASKRSPPPSSTGVSLVFGKDKYYCKHYRAFSPETTNWLSRQVDDPVSH